MKRKSGPVRGRRILIVLPEEEDELLQEVARAETLPLATFVRRAAVLYARQRKQELGL